MCAAPVSLPLSNERWDQFRLKDSFSDRLGNVLTVRRFLVCMQRELEERLNFRSFMLHITERDPALFSHHDLEVLNCDRSTNRERLQNLVRIIGDKGEDPNVLQNIYCSLKDSYESDDSLSQHYHLAQLFSLRASGTNPETFEKTLKDPWEILKKLPPVSVEANAAKQLLDRLKYYDCELPKDSSYVEMDWIRRKCQEWLSKRQSIPGAVEELVEAFLCTKGLGYLVSYMYPTGYSNPPATKTVINRLGEEWKTFFDFLGFTRKEVDTMDSVMSQAQHSGNRMRILLRALRIPDLGQRTKNIMEKSLTTAGINLTPSRISVGVPSPYQVSTNCSPSMLIIFPVPVPDDIRTYAMRMAIVQPNQVSQSAMEHTPTHASRPGKQHRSHKSPSHSSKKQNCRHTEKEQPFTQPQSSHSVKSASESTHKHPSIRKSLRPTKILKQSPEVTQKDESLSIPSSQVPEGKDTSIEKPSSPSKLFQSTLGYHPTITSTSQLKNLYTIPLRDVADSNIPDDGRKAPEIGKGQSDVKHSKDFFPDLQIVRNQVGQRVQQRNQEEEQRPSFQFSDVESTSGSSTWSSIDELGSDPPLEENIRNQAVRPARKYLLWFHHPTKKGSEYDMIFAAVSIGEWDSLKRLESYFDKKFRTLGFCTNGEYSVTFDEGGVARFTAEPCGDFGVEPEVSEKIELERVERAIATKHKSPFVLYHIIVRGTEQDVLKFTISVGGIVEQYQPFHLSVLRPMCPLPPHSQGTPQRAILPAEPQGPPPSSGSIIHPLVSLPQPEMSSDTNHSTSSCKKQDSSTVVPKNSQLQPVATDQVNFASGRSHNIMMADQQRQLVRSCPSYATCPRLLTPAYFAQRSPVQQHEPMLQLQEQAGATFGSTISHSHVGKSQMFSRDEDVSSVPIQTMEQRSGTSQKAEEDL